MGTVRHLRTLLAAALVGLAGPAFAASAPAPALQDPIAQYLMAVDAEHHGDWAEAGRLFTAVWDRTHDGQALREAFLFSLGSGSIDTALKLAEHLTPDMPEAPIAQALLAAQAIHGGNLAEARKLSNELPDNGMSVLLSAMLEPWLSAAANKAHPDLDALSALADFPALRTLHTALIDDYAGLPATPAAYVELGKLGEAPRLIAYAADYYRRTGQPAKAKAIVAAMPASTSGLVRTALSHPASVVAGKPDLQTGSAEAYYDLAEILLDAEHPDVALFYAQIAAYLAPGASDMHFLVGEILQAQGRNREAAAELLRAPEGSSFSLLARLDAAGSLERIGDLQGAVAIAAKLSADYPSVPEATLVEAGLLRHQKQLTRSIALYTDALAMLTDKDDRRPQALFGRAIAYDLDHQDAAAENDLKASLALEPDQPLVMNYLGYFWVSRDQHLADAMPLLQRAFILKSDDPAIADSLGWALYQTADYPAAIARLELAAEGSPADSTINTHLGDAYWRVGRLAEARHQWERALIDADPADISGLRARLQDGAPPVPGSAQSHAALEPLR